MSQVQVPKTQTQVQFPIEIVYFVLERSWEGDVEVKIYEYAEKLKKWVPYIVHTELEKVIRKRLEPYVDSDIEKSLERIERALKEKHAELLADVYDFISKYDKPISAEKITIERDKYGIRIKHDNDVLITIVPLKTNDIGVFIYGKYEKAVDEVLSKLDSHLRFEKKVFKLLDGICVVEAEVDIRPYKGPVEINVGGFVDVRLPRGYVVKPGSKVLVECKYRRDELHREVDVPVYAMLELWESTYAKEVW